MKISSKLGEDLIKEERLRKTNSVVPYINCSRGDKLRRERGLFSRTFLVFLWSVAIMANCRKDKEQEAQPPPPPPPVYNDEILAYANYVVGYSVFWINRGYDPLDPLQRPVFTEDGDILCQGLGYWGYDNVEDFEIKINYSDPRMEVEWWLDYPCLPDNPSPPDTYRPGGRVYADYDCTEYYNRPQCYPADILPGTHDCSWQWTGSVCAALVYWTLFDVDKNIASHLAPSYSGQQMLTILLSLDQVEEVTRTNAEPGDLIFMDIDHDGDFSDHVAILSDKDPWGPFDDDKCIGVIGYYALPFHYTACEATMAQHNDALFDDWPEWYGGHPDWRVDEWYVRYVRIYEP